MEAKQGTAFLGGQKVVTQGIQSTTLVDASYPGATVTVFNFGTTTLSTIFADNVGTPLANPFTSSLTTGDFIFYAANGRYTIQMSGAGMPTTETITDVLLNDPTASTTMTASAFISSSATPATSGVLRMAAGDVGPAFKSSLGGVDLVFTKNSSDAIDINTALVLHGTLSTSGSAIAGGVISGTTGTFSGAVTANSFTAGGGSTFTNLTITGVVGTVFAVAGNTLLSGSLTTVGAITGASYSGGAISGTTGTFSGAVSATAISGTTGSFSSNVTVTGTLAVGGGTALSTTNQTGTGNLVLATSPTLVTPILGVATATTINKLTFTTPATGSTFTLIDGKTFAVDNSLELAGTDGVKHTFAATAPTGGVLAYGVPRFQQFTGNGTFTIPTGVTAVKVTLIGGGGGAGGGAAAGDGGGGGSGGIAIKWLSSLTPGNTIAVTVGGTAAGGTTGNPGTIGNASSIASGTQVITTVTANGGVAGGAGVAGGGFGGGGAAISTNGDINGGGIAGAAGTGTTWGGAGGGSALLGGAPSSNGGTTGAAGLANSGAGGSGGHGVNTGGAGAAGLVIFEWVV